MSKLLIIFGITGQQGSSVADVVLKDPTLSKMYRIRGLTRDPSGPDAQTWASKGIEVVRCEMDDRSSIKDAFRGAHTVFAMTVSQYKPGGIDQELAQGKVIADEAVAAGARFLIFSAVPSASKISGGKYPVDSFDVKDDVKDYIETLPIKSAFFLPGTFMQNFQTYLAPRPTEEAGTFAMYGFVTPTTKYPLIDIANDAGKFVGAILAEPGKYSSKTLAAATRAYTMTEMAEIMSRSSGKKITYAKVPKDIFAQFLPALSRVAMLNMLSYFEEFGYYGPQTDALVAEAASSARGKPTEFEEYLKREPLPL